MDTGRYGEHDNSDSMTVGIVALGGTSLTSSTYGSVSFNLTFFNELSELDEMIVSIKAKLSSVGLRLGPITLFAKFLHTLMRLSRAAKAIRKLVPCPHLYVVLVTHVHTPDVSSHMRNK